MFVVARVFVSHTCVRVVFVVARVGLVVARAIVACAICIRDVSQQQLRINLFVYVCGCLVGRCIVCAWLIVIAWD